MTSKKYNYNTAADADKSLIIQLEEQFPGKKFKIISHDKKFYDFRAVAKILDTMVSDQDGIIAKVSGSDENYLNKGYVHTDYLASYYMPKVAKPIEAILNQFDFIENYSVSLFAWNNNHNYIGFELSNPEFFEKTDRHYRIIIFLKDGLSEEEYGKQIHQVYDVLCEQQEISFGLAATRLVDLKYEASQDRLGKAAFLANKLLTDVGAEPKNPNYRKYSLEMMTSDLIVENSTDFDRLDSYGVVWKHTPSKD
ncbi:hypothetical protein RyT2_17080 [Pseudolactococcus yaeyamensis]